MMGTMTGLATLIVLAATAYSQEVPRFDVASIRPSEPGRERIDAVPGSLTMRNTRLSRCIQWAYDMQDYQVSGPGWINETAFDILAKASTPVKEPDLRLMLQSLLADRFKLVSHRETKELPAMVLTVGKNGHKLKPVDVEPAETFKTGKLTLTGTGATVAQLTTFLSRELRTPVIDQTGLTGRFNYTLDINQYVTEEVRARQPVGGGPPPDAPGIIAMAIQSQLGLKLDSKKMPIDMLVVDRLEKVPSEN